MYLTKKFQILLRKVGNISGAAPYSVKARINPGGLCGPAVVPVSLSQFFENDVCVHSGKNHRRITPNIQENNGWNSPYFILDMLGKMHLYSISPSRAEVAILNA